MALYKSKIKFFGGYVMKRFLSLCLALIVAVGICFSAPMTIEAEAYVAHSQTEAVAWAKDKIGKKVGDGWCAALTIAYYQYLGVTPNTGNACDYAADKTQPPPGWTYQKYYNGFVAQPGDIAVWSRNDALDENIRWAGHVAIVVSADKNGMNIVDQNHANYPKKCGTRYAAYSSGGTFWGVIRPDFNTDPTAALKTPVITFDKSSYTMGDTIKISWVLSPSDSNLSHYWINVTNPAGNFDINEKIDKSQSTFSFATPGVGTYKVTLFATPYGSVSGEGSMTDTKSITINPKITTYSIKYNANGGSGSMASYQLKIDEYLKFNGSSFTRAGYKQTGWNVLRSSDNKWYVPSTGWCTQAEIDAGGLTKYLYPLQSDTYQFGYSAWCNPSVTTDTFTFYAVWERLPYSTVTYNANGGSGAPTAQTKEQGVSLTLSSTVPTRAGYDFLFWADSISGGVSNAYKPGGTYTQDKDVTLYAIWQCNHSLGTTIVNAKDPTYTEVGYTGDTKCNTCGAILSKGTTIPMLTLGKPTTSAYSTADGVKLTWNAIDGAKSYKIFRKEFNGSTWSAWTSPASGVTGTSYIDKTAKLGSTYIYAVSAVNASQTSSFTQCSTFKHSVVPVVTVSNSGNGIKVTWNAINGAASYKVFRRAYNESTKTWGGWSKLKEGYTSTSYNDTLGNLGVTYSYTVVAVNSTLSSNYVSSVSIKCNPTLKPTIKNTTDGIKVEWSKIFGATSYKVFRRELDTSNNTWSGWASVTTGYTGNAFVDKTAKLGVTYSYAVVGVNSTTSSNYVATSGLKCDIPVTVKATSTTSGINLTWNKVNGATGYTIYRKAYNTKNNTWGSWSVLKTGYTGTSYTDTLGNLGASYIYCVRATVGSFSGSYVQSSSVKCNVVPKTTINNTTNGIKVSWSNVFGATSYKIFRRELNTTNNTWGSWAVVTSGLTSSAYVDKTSRLGVTYSYAVVAVNSTTSSSYIATSGLKCDPIPTVSVSNTQTGVSVKWNAINGAESYIVYRRAYDDSTKTWGKWSQLKKDYKSTSYVDSLGNLGTTYNYTVRAVANGEKGSYVSSVSIKCNIPPKVTIANTSTGIKVSWSNVFGATSYKVFRRELNTTNNTWSAWASPASGVTGSAIMDKTAKLGVTYSYAVVASNSSASSSYIATAGLKCDITPTVTIANTTNGIKVSWNAINGAGSYKIYRKELNATTNTWSGWRSVSANATGTSYVDKTAKFGTEYIYTVSAVGNGFTSSNKATTALKADITPTVTIGSDANGIRVNWNAINGADSYIIYKKTYNAKTGKWGTWTTVAQNYKGTTVVDTSAVNGTYYMYTVRATKGAFNSSFAQSNVVKYVK